MNAVKPASLLLLCACLVPGLGRAQQTYTASAEILAQQVDRIYTRGMDYLARTQQTSGDWPDESFQNSAAITGLAVISLLAHGDDPNNGPYSTAIHRGLDYLIKQQNTGNGFIGTTMYNHGFATLALAESYGAVNDARLGPALQRAVKLILTSQEMNSFKAWRYSAESRDADTTVSGAQMVALLAARNAGVPVPESSIQDGLRFYYSCQTPDGGIGYTSAGGPNATRTAIGCLVMCLSKQKNTSQFRAAFDFLKNAGDDGSYPAYSRYYESQAFFQGSPEQWDRWNHNNINVIRASQTTEGSWEGQMGATFNTAASLLSLALNYRFLPIYER